MAAQGLVHQCDHPGAKSQQRLLAPLCPCAPGQAGGQNQHPQHPVSVGGHCLPAQEWHLPHSSSFKTNKRRKKREKERHEAPPRALPKPQPCSPQGTPAHAPAPGPQPSIKCSAVGQLWAEKPSPAQAATHHLLFQLISAQFN